MDLLKLIQNYSQDKRKCQGYDTQGGTVPVYQSDHQRVIKHNSDTAKQTTQQPTQKKFSATRVGLGRDFGDGNYYATVGKNLELVDSRYVQNYKDMQALQKALGTGYIFRRPDGTFSLKANGVQYFGGNRMQAADGTMQNYDLNSIINSKKKKTSNPDKIYRGRTLREVVVKPTVHTATYTMPTDADQYTKGALSTPSAANNWGEGWSTNAWGFTGNHKGQLSDDIRKELGLEEGSDARAAQQKLQSLGFNISDDNVWGKQSQAAYDRWKEQNKLVDAYTKTNQAVKSNDVSTSWAANALQKATTQLKQNAPETIDMGITPTGFNRGTTRAWLRNKNINPYSISGSERRALRQYLNKEQGYDENIVRNLNSKYNLGFKFQQGGSINMNEQQQMQQAFLQYLAQQTGAKSQQELEQIIQQMGEDGLKQAYAQFMQAMQQQQVQAAKFGAKLNYIKKLNGQCPAGTELKYFKSGGRLCKKCMAIEAQGGTVDKPVGDAIAQFKAAVGRNKKKFGNKYNADQLAGRKPVGKDSQGRDLYLDGDGNAKPIAKHGCGSKLRK